MTKFLSVYKFTLTRAKAFGGPLSRRPQTRPFLLLCFPPKGLRAAMFQRAPSAAASRSERGSVLPWPHAEPLETKMFRSAKKCSIVSARTRPAERFTIYGSAFSGEFKTTSGIAFSRSIKCACTAFTCVSASFSVIMCFTASPNAQICGTPSVPGRRFFSCPPPKLCGKMRTPLFTYSAPTPFGACTLWPETLMRSTPSLFGWSGILQKPCTASA